jgi:hypothetical protein
MSDETKLAEHRGYSKGYYAGLRKKKQGIKSERLSREKAAFWNRAFISALPATIDAQNWTRGDKPIVGLVDRVKLAAETADEALKYFQQYR